MKYEFTIMLLSLTACRTIRGTVSLDLLEKVWSELCRRGYVMDVQELHEVLLDLEKIGKVQIDPKKRRVKVKDRKFFVAHEYMYRTALRNVSLQFLKDAFRELENIVEKYRG